MRELMFRNAMDHPNEPPLGDDALDSLDAFALVVEVPANERSAAIERVCQGNAVLRREVEDLLRHHDDPVRGLRDDAVGAVHGGLAGMVDAFLAEPDLSESKSAESKLSESKSATKSAGANRSGRRTAWLALGAAAAIAVATWLVALVADWGLAAQRSASAWRKAEAASDPVACRGFLMQIEPAHRDAGWHDLLQRIDPVVHRHGFAKARAVEGTVAFLADGVPCCAIGTGNTLRLVDVRTGAVLFRFEANGTVRFPRFDTSRNRVAAWGHSAGASRATLWVWEMTTCAVLCHADVERVAPGPVRFGPAGRILQWQGSEAVQECSIATGKVRSLTRRRWGAPSRVSSRDRSWHVDLDYGGSVVLVGHDPVAHRSLGKHRGGILAAAFSPDGLRLATASRDFIQIWSLEAGLLETFARGATQVAFDESGQQLVALAEHEAVVLRW